MSRPYDGDLHFPDERRPGAWIGGALLALALTVGLIAGFAVGRATSLGPCPDGWGSGYANGELVECVPPLCGSPDRYLPEEGVPYMDVPCIPDEEWRGEWEVVTP